ncbi:DUF2259 domain-containing protein [Deinococcus sonorensis]|uniref:DUF2259 domain-containing protein n=2 Tax=Deinococcus sonorensis TaxID=309891 RepID=A0AAU7UBR5_9DEIO
MRRLLLALLVLFSLSVHAADRPLLSRYGFSPDARYHLLVSAWVRDGSGFPAARLQITDVRRNVLLVLDELTERTGTPDPERVAARLLARHHSDLARYALLSPVQGEPLFVVAPPAPQSWPPALPQRLTAGTLTFLLSRVALPSGCPAPDPAHPPAGLRLSVNGHPLQADARLPASRRCAGSYQLETGWRLGSAVAVVLRAYQPGFEGPDAWPLVVAGTLPDR